jgi:NADPH:quinone reductase-like Zn-dependent oxidoreductase
MRAITVRDRNAGIDGLALTDMPHPHAAENDVIVRAHAASFTPGELQWPGTWSDRAGHDRTPSITGHERVGEVDVVFDVIGGDILERSTELVRPGGTLVTAAMPPTAQPKDGRAIFFVVEPDRARLTDLAQRLRAGRLNPIVGAVLPLSETASAFARHRRTPGKTIIQVADEQGAQQS